MRIVAQLRTAGSMSAFLGALIIGAICVGFGSGAFSKDLTSKDSDDDDDSTKQTSSVPTIYLDLRTNYASVPAGSLPIGLGSPALFTAAQILNVTPIHSFTQPVLRLDIDRMDDDDNRLFGVTAEVAWIPKPSYLLTLRTPLYAVRK